MVNDTKSKEKAKKDNKGRKGRSSKKNVSVENNSEIQNYVESAKIFNRWDTQELVIEDQGLVDVIDISPRIFPKTGGREAKYHFGKSRVNIVERLVNRMFVAGHRGKKHKLTSGINTGKTLKNVKNVIEAFEIIEERIKKNPIQVLIKAIENSAPVEEVITYQRGGIMAREAVVISPQRRVDLAIRHIVEGSYMKRHKSKKTAGQSLADEIINAYNNNPDSFAISEKNRREKEAEGAR